MPDTSLGITYPASSSHDRIWEHVQTVADDVNALLVAEYAGWTAYTPTFTASSGTPAMGTGGTLTGRYKQIGKLVHLSIYGVWGTAGSAGTGQWSFSLPVAASAVSSQLMVGSAILNDTSAGSVGHLAGICLILPSASVTTLSPYGAASGAVATGTSPFTWTSTDFFAFNITYEAA